MALATRIAVMDKGRIVQYAPPIEIYRRPATTFVANFVGNPPMNLLPVEAQRRGRAAAAARRRADRRGPARADAPARRLGQRADPRRPPRAPAPSATPARQHHPRRAVRQREHGAGEAGDPRAPGRARRVTARIFTDDDHRARRGRDAQLRHPRTSRCSTPRASASRPEGESRLKACETFRVHGHPRRPGGRPLLLHALRRARGHHPHRRHPRLSQGRRLHHRPRLPRSAHRPPGRRRDGLPRLERRRPRPLLRRHRRRDARLRPRPIPPGRWTGDPRPLQGPASRRRGHRHHRPRRRAPRRPRPSPRAPSRCARAPAGTAATCTATPSIPTPAARPRRCTPPPGRPASTSSPSPTTTPPPSAATSTPHSSPDLVFVRGHGGDHRRRPRQRLSGSTTGSTSA